VGGWDPHDIPSAAELLDAVRRFLESEVLPVTEGRVRFHVRVAANVVGMVAREIVLGPEQAAAHAGRLEQLGVHSDAELAAAIRSGALDSRWEEVRAAVGSTVLEKLAVANPGYAVPRDPAPPVPRDPVPRDPVPRHDGGEEGDPR
jgi:hypothetical protein